MAASKTLKAPARSEIDLEALQEIERRALWLGVRIIDAANRERENLDGIKVGGHPASSASSVSIMTALWFHHLTPHDRVAAKPHAGPVLHAMHYLMGLLDRRYLTMLRSIGGLQSYPSRTKDPIRVDFSTGSVGLGASAPLFAATTRRYVDAHFGQRPEARFFSLLGDAELDEGNVWEAIADPAAQGLSNVRWVIDFNRQSLDRVVPGVRINQWRKQFEAAGWNVIEAKHGRRLQEVLARPDSGAFATWFDDISNEQYQSLFGLSGAEFRERFLLGAPAGVAEFCAGFSDEELIAIVTDLGGHDLACLIEAFEACDVVADRPSVVFCYTVKGWSLPIAGNPKNHSAQLTGEQIDALRVSLGASPEDEWAPFDPDSPAGRLVAARGREFADVKPGSTAPLPEPPHEVGAVQGSRSIASQEVFGRTVTALARNENIGRYLVTTAPDVATTTNLAGFINRVGSFSPEERTRWSEDRNVEWYEGPTGQHIELGISEMNFFTLLGQLGLAWDLSDQALLPIGTVYDPFVLRGLDALIHAVYSGARFVIAGTPSGVTLAPEGGAHQSTITPSVGLELPNLVLIEPAFARSVEWLLCDALARISRNPSGKLPADADDEPKSAYYFRLSTRPIAQEAFEAARARLGDTVLRQQVIAGAYRLVDARADAVAAGLDTRRPEVTLVASGAVMPEVLAAAERLAEEGVGAHIVDVTSQSRLFAAWQRASRASIRTASLRERPGVLNTAFPAGVPIVTIHDASSHNMAWLGAALQVPAFALGVDEFGQSGTIGDLYRSHGLDSDTIMTAALSVLAG
jgi:pyruvate dehydrogenase E1 component